MVQSASLSSFQSWSSSAEVSSTSVDSSDFQCCGFGLLPLRSGASGNHVLMGALHTARKPGSHPSYCAVHGRKEAELQSMHRTNEATRSNSKQLEATHITQAAIQASRLLTSGLLFGLVGRDRRRVRRTWEHGLMSQGDDGSFFLEPMLTMVISQCQDHGSDCMCTAQWTAEN